MARLASILLLPAASAFLVACSGSDARPRLEDDARKSAPVPACLVELGPRPKGAVAVSLKEPDYWKTVFPAYDTARSELPTNAVSCTRSVTVSDLATTLVRPKPGDVTLGGGPDRLKIVWLRTTEMGDGSASGALALLRAFPDVVEVYAVGAHRGRPDRTKMGIERLGPELVAVVQDDGCVSGQKSPEPCESTMSLYAARGGALLRVASFALERVAFAVNAEAGVPGRLRYHLVAAPAFIEGGVRLLEQVKVTDEVGHEVRKAELERTYAYRSDDVMSPSDDPIWPRVYPMEAAPKIKKQ